MLCVHLCGYRRGNQFEGVQKLCGRGSDLFTNWSIFMSNTRFKASADTEYFSTGVVSSQKSVVESVRALHKLEVKNDKLLTFGQYHFFCKDRILLKIENCWHIYWIPNHCDQKQFKGDMKSTICKIRLQLMFEKKVVTFSTYNFLIKNLTSLSGKGKGIFSPLIKLLK